VIALFALWRVMAWIGEWKCGGLVAEGEGSGGWRDKGTAGWGGCGAQNSSGTSAIHFFSLLALERRILAFPPFREPSPLLEPLFR
jgi:hypothetical protein